MPHEQAPQPSANPAPRRTHARHRASALVTTLLVLVVLSTIVVAFLQSMSVERSVAKSALNRYRAELAAESGMHHIVSKIADLVASDTYLVVASSQASAPYLYIGRPRGIPPTNQVLYEALFSGGLSSTNLASSLPPVRWDPQFPTVASNWPKIPALISPIETRWIEITNAPGARATARFSYWVEDLSGFVNVLTAGNTNSSGGHERSSGTNVSEIPLYTLFSTNAVDPKNTAATSIVSNRACYLSDQSVRQIFSNKPTAATNLVALGLECEEVARIPLGFGYAQEGGLKHNINSYVSVGGAVAVSNIASAIAVNLPQFAVGRRGGFPSDHNYLMTLAANIVDYVDTDSDSTSDMVSPNSKYRGVDSYPFLSEFAEKLRYDRKYKEGGVWYVEVSVTPFLEIWNMGNKAASGAVRFDNINKDEITLGFFEYRLDETNRLIPPSRLTNTVPVTVANMAPNAYVVIQMPAVRYKFEAGPNEPSYNGNPNKLPLNGGTDPVSQSSYQYYWNGVLVDQPGGLREQKGKILELGGSPDWTAGLPGLRYGRQGNRPQPQRFGDPRATVYIRGTNGDPFLVAANDYDTRGSWWGRNLAHGLAYETDPRSWPDNGHRVDPPGNKCSDSTDPVKASKPDGYGTFTNAPVAYFSNAGSFRSVTELGNIFDPAQWLVTNGSNIPPEATADSTYGGGMTLRIGRPEFAKFSTNGLRASQLLDLFCTTNKISTLGRINLNTATFETLRALGAGVSNAQDACLSPRTLSNASQLPGGPDGTSFAETVLANRPFLSPSQLATMTNGKGVFFGNLAQYGNLVSPEWNDRAAENYFGKVYDLSTVRSRAFRIYVSGQALDSSGTKGISTVTRVYNVIFKPLRNQALDITNVSAKVVFSSEL